MGFRLGTIVRHHAAEGNQPAQELVDLHSRAQAIRRIQKHHRQLRAKAVREYQKIRTQKQRRIGA